MKILGLCSYPVEAAATRFRLAQFANQLQSQGIDLTISPFLEGAQFREFYSDRGLIKKLSGLIGPLFRRVAGIGSARKYDLLLIQREAMFFGPGIFEWLYQKIGRVPMILDLDDATYVRYVSPTYGKLGSYFKFFGKTDNLIERADLVICGNRFIADYVNAKGRKSLVIPTVVDGEIFCPVEKYNEIPVIGWIGTHSTFPFLETLFPVLVDLAKKHRFKLKIVGSGRDNVSLDGIEVENAEWKLEREVRDFQELDIGLYPIETGGSLDSQWLLGKSGFKAIQYLAVGVPYVVTPVGVCAEIGVHGETHFNAMSPELWYNYLDLLISDKDLRKKMGKAGRELSIREYGLAAQAEKLADAFRAVLK